MRDLGLLPWRVGRKLGRTLYAVVGDEPSDDDVLLGLLDDERIADLIVDRHNARVASGE